MSNIPEEYIEAHVLVCSRAEPRKRKRAEGNHHSQGAFRRTTIRQRRRECAKSLYKECLKRGIEPVLRWSHLPELAPNTNSKEEE